MIADHVDALSVSPAPAMTRPSARAGSSRVDGDDLAARGILVGPEPEDGPVVIDEGVVGFEFADQVEPARSRADRRGR